MERIVRRITKSLGSKSKLIIRNLPGPKGSQDIRSSISKFSGTYGWKPRVGMDEGISKLAFDYKRDS
jgi:nucleoside-diphosphate-sugar epimerase